MQLHFQAFGAGRPLIILHGLFGSLDNWRLHARRLGEQFHVFTLDQRNHGNSPHAPVMNYSGMAGDVVEFMNSQGLDGANVLGHSMGGKTAMELALRYPDRVEKLLVADVQPGASPPRHLEILDALLRLDLRAFQTRKQIEDALAPGIPDLAVRQFLLKSVKPGPAGGFQWKMGLKEIAANYPHLNEAVEPDRRFAGPTLFIRGGNSEYLKKSDLPLIRQLFPNARLETIPHAGHWLHVEAPERFLHLASDFLAGQSGGERSRNS